MVESPLFVSDFAFLNQFIKPSLLFGELKGEATDC